MASKQKILLAFFVVYDIIIQTNLVGIKLAKNGNQILWEKIEDENTSESQKHQSESW